MSLVSIVKNEWPDPIPLGDGHTPPPFPVQVLPDWMRDYAVAVADEMQVAVDLPAVLGLVAMSIATGPHYRVQVDANWTEPLNIYAVVALPPSAGKSPVLKRMLGAIFAHERDQREETAQRMAHVEQKRRIAEKAMKRAEDKGDIGEAQRCLDDLLNTPMPVIPRMIADDATPEAVAQLLHEQGERLALISTEGGPFEIMAGRYGDKVNIEVYLKSWSGDPLTVDRMNRAAITLAAPRLTVGITVQPKVIADLATKEGFRGRGLLDRFMYSIPEDNVGTRDMVTRRTTDNALAVRYDSWIDELLQRKHPFDADIITVDDAAYEMFATWRQGHENRMSPDGDLRSMATWVSKMQATVVRVAGILAASDGRNTIDATTMHRAMVIGAYWLEHAKVVHDIWSADDRVVSAKAILQWAAPRGLAEFSLRDVYNAMRKRFPTAEDSREPLNVLIERGWLRPLFDGPLVTGRRGKESPRFQVHPEALTQFASHASHAFHAPETKNEFSSLLYSYTATSERHATHETHETHEPPF